MRPDTRVAGLCEFPTFADTRANDEVAPIPAIRSTVIDRIKSIQSGISAPSV